MRWSCCAHGVGYDEAIALLRQAVELDPLSGAVYRELARSYLAGGTARRGADGNPKITRVESARRVRALLGTARSASWQGRLDEALEAAKREIHDTFRLLALANVYHAQGRHAESDAALEELIETYADTAAFQIAEAFAYRDDRDQAFAWLERAYAQRDAGMNMIRASPSLRKLHGDPRWLPFLEKVGLAD